MLLTVLEPGTKAQGPSPLRLASTTIAPGQVNGLVPKVTLRTATGASISTQDPRMRPGVIALIPASCNCVNTLQAIASQAAMVNLRVFVVAPSSDADTDALSGQIGTNATVYYDATGALATAEKAAGFTPSGVSLLLENRDGTIYHRQPDATGTTTSGLNQSLEDMLNPAGTSS